MKSASEFITAIREHEGIIRKVCILYEREQQYREDLFQEIVLNAWKGISSFRGQSKFSTWLYRVAINTAISFFRRSKKEVSLLQGLPEQVLAVPTSDINPALEELYFAIEALSKIEKALVMLFLDNYSYAEIASLLGMSENHIAVKMSRIRKKLKQLIITKTRESWN